MDCNGLQYKYASVVQCENCHVGSLQGRNLDCERNQVRRVKIASGNLQGNVTNELYSFD